MDFVSKNTIFDLKMMVKSGLENIIWKSLVIFITEFVILGNFMKLGKVVSHMEEFQKYFF